MLAATAVFAADITLPASCRFRSPLPRHDITRCHFPTDCTCFFDFRHFLMPAHGGTVEGGGMARH